MNAPHDAARAVAAALAPRRIARHRERVRRAGRGQRAGPRRARTSSRSASASPISRRRTTCRTRRSRRSAAASTATRRRPASTSCARPRRKDIGARRGLDIAPDDVVVGAGAKPFIAYTIASVTDYGAGDEVIYPVPGFPIYESQIVANGAVPVPIYLRESRDFAFDPAELEAKITPKTRLLILNTPHNPTGGILQRGRSRRDRRDPRAASAGLGVRRRDLFAPRLRRRVRLARDAARACSSARSSATARRRPGR